MRISSYVHRFQERFAGPPSCFGKDGTERALQYNRVFLGGSGVYFSEFKASCAYRVPDHQ
jgi:hypothetical protein